MVYTDNGNRLEYITMEKDNAPTGGGLGIGFVHMNNQTPYEMDPRLDQSSNMSRGGNNMMDRRVSTKPQMMGNISMNQTQGSGGSSQGKLFVDGQFVDYSGSLTPQERQK